MQEAFGSRSEAIRFTSLAATGSYLAHDRMHTQYTAKEFCRDMAKPRTSVWGKLKRTQRYFIEFPALIRWRFEKPVEDAEELRLRLGGLPPD